MSSEDQYKCFGAQYGAPLIQTPKFVLNSLADAWQLENILMLDCFQNGSADLDNFRLKTISDLKTEVLIKPGNGLSCQLVLPIAEHALIYSGTRLWFIRFNCKLHFVTGTSTELRKPQS